MATPKQVASRSVPPGQKQNVAAFDVRDLLDRLGVDVDKDDRVKPALGA